MTVVSRLSLMNHDLLGMRGWVVLQVQEDFPPMEWVLSPIGLRVVLPYERGSSALLQISCHCCGS